MNATETVYTAIRRRLLTSHYDPGTEKRGAIVTPWHVENTAEVFRLRILLEGYAATLCAQHASDAQITRMEQICTEMEQAHIDKRPDWIKAMDRGNREFHQMFYEGAGSPHLRLSGRHLLGNGEWARSMVSCHLNAAMERFRRRSAARD